MMPGNIDSVDDNRLSLICSGPTASTIALRNSICLNRVVFTYSLQFFLLFNNCHIRKKVDFGQQTLFSGRQTCIVASVVKADLAASETSYPMSARGESTQVFWNESESCLLQNGSASSFYAAARLC